MILLDWLNSLSVDLLRDPAGNLRMDSNVTVGKKGQKVGGKSKIFEKKWKSVQKACITRTLVGFISTQYCILKNSIFGQFYSKIRPYFAHFSCNCLQSFSAIIFPREFIFRSCGKCGNPASLYTKNRQG